MADAPSWCIDFAYAEQGCLFVFGWFVEPGPGFQGLLLHINGRHIDLAHNVIRTKRPDVAPATRTRRPAHDFGLLIAAEIGAELTPETQIELWVIMADGSVQPIGAETSANQARFVHFARGNLLSLLHLLSSVPEPQRPRLAAIADRARTPAEAAAVASSDPFSVTLICAPTPDLLLVLGRINEPRRHPAPVELLLGEAPARRRLRLLPGPEGSAQFLMLADLGTTQPDRFVLAQRLPQGRHAASFPREDVRQGMASLDALLLPLDLETQLTVLEDLADTLAARAEPADLARLRRLWLERTDRLTTGLDRPDPRLRLVLDHARQVGPHGIFLVGWALYDPDQLRGIAFRAPFQPPFDLPRAWVADPRHDVWTTLRDEGERVETDALGFTCYVPVALAETAGCIVAVTYQDGSVVRMRVDITPTADEPLRTIQDILATFPQTHRDLRRLLDHHVGPAVGALWASRRRPALPPASLHFGPPPKNPETSVVVPIYGRHDFIEFQLAQFANDPSMRGQELIYVIDDPAIYDQVRVNAIDLFGCYQVPFMLLYGHRNNGYAAATNLGAAGARGEFLLLLNSDVLPTTPHWLRALVAAHRAHAAGAVAPKLLYEDGSVQHAGMRFTRLPVWDGLWVNDHPGKGQPNPPRTETIPCAALTGACLLLRAETYRTLGGLSEDYIVGDFEDSDLCLRLLRNGQTNYLVPSVTLTHLERQSQDRIGSQAWRANLTLYNCWLHGTRWNEEIARLAALS
jgi:GT2 family glycosyltransferase